MKKQRHKTSVNPQGQAPDEMNTAPKSQGENEAKKTNTKHS
ncbi:small, acid-soluble spore protein L [Bacillaceae bacterium SIJ1]|nr:small, acid-soluble spore protein L [Litoribacterium kuwaitense]NGP43764.1 small, acid-soluble spore protein L [Litoribacterium kuwaitense]